MERKKLGHLVVEQGQITEQQLDTALAYQRATGKPLGEVLLLLGIATEEQLLEALATQQNVEPWDIKQDPPTKEALGKIPAEICLKYLLVPVHIHDGTLTVAMRNPGDLEVVDLLYAMTRLKIEPVQAIDNQLSSSLQELFGNDPSLRRSFDVYVSKALAENEEKSDVNKVLNTITEEETRPVIGLVNEIFSNAIKLRASDIHFEPKEDSAELRYRIDGRLIPVRQIPGSLVRMVVARIKIMADLDISNHRHPQDGRIEIRSGRETLDARVNCLPTQHGSRVAIRILDRGIALKTLDQLGFSKLNASLFQDMIRKPYGIVLVTGPTGSGKTSTLYAGINDICDVGINIMTCEDPIEYELKGVSQSQVNERAGLTFAAQLRAILRQDPDVVLVGEIRDGETAETAVRAALTGHLVLTTLHCNDAASAIPRLVDMGAEPYLLSTSLIGVVAQRLLRRLCPDCKIENPVTGEDRDLLNTYGFEETQSTWAPVGCAKCNGTGYFDRTAVNEVLPVTEHIGDLISQRASTEAIRAAAKPYGYKPIQFDAMDRVATGQTSLDEVKRIIFLDTFKTIEENDSLRLAS